MSSSTPPTVDRETDEHAVPDVIERELTGAKPDVIAWRMTQAEKALKQGANRFGQIEGKVSAEVAAVRAHLAAELATLKPKPLGLPAVVAIALSIGGLVWGAAEIASRIPPRDEVRGQTELLHQIRTEQEKQRLQLDDARDRLRRLEERKNP